MEQLFFSQVCEEFWNLSNRLVNSPVIIWIVNLKIRDYLFIFFFFEANIGIETYQEVFG